MFSSYRIGLSLFLAVTSTVSVSNASATVCNRSKIQALSVADAAKTILANSDVVGVGSANEERSDPNVLRQKIVFIDLMKGKEHVVSLSPYRSGGVGIHDGWVRQFQVQPSNRRLFALTKQSDGYAGGKCILAILENFPQEQMLTALNSAANK